MVEAWKAEERMEGVAVRVTVEATAQVQRERRVEDMEELSRGDAKVPSASF